MKTVFHYCLFIRHKSILFLLILFFFVAFFKPIMLNICSRLNQYAQKIADVQIMHVHYTYCSYS